MVNPPDRFGDALFVAWALIQRAGKSKALAAQREKYRDPMI
jgi:hypothetical protein